MARRQIENSTRALATALMLGLAQPAVADAAEDQAEGGSTEAPATDASRQVYTPADFARYSPRSAWDMVRQIPGFTVRDNEQTRGFGNATGNILINGARPTNKTDEFETQLSRIPASSVVRIEVLDGASLAIPGLSGQVANIVVKSGGAKGQFSWTPDIRAHFSDPILLRGDVTVSGKSGNLDYSVGLAEDGNRSGAGGPTTITLPGDTLFEARDDHWKGNFDQPKFSTRLGLDLGGGARANLNGSIQRGWFKYREVSNRLRPGGIDRQRLINEDEDSWGYELAGDVQFPLGAGKLKLIALRRFADSDYSSDAVTRLADATPPFGDIYRQHQKLGESIARAEYGWKMLGGDWQVSGEGAFNRLGSVASVGTLQVGGDFSTDPFAPATGGVSEDRYNGSLSYGRPLGAKLNLQIVAEAEYSTIAAGGLSRSFFRPKGSVSLAWNPTPKFDLSVKVMRRVLQLSLYDFLGRVFLGEENENSGNAALVPQQDWTLEIEANRKLGAWGSTKLRLVARQVQDYVTVVPLPGGGESTGNIAKARAAAIDWTATLQFDPIGWKGAKLDLRALLQTSSLKDPLTGLSHQYNYFTDTQISGSLRWDVPRSDWALGINAEYYHVQPGYRLQEVGTQWEGPVWGGVFVEHKNVFGLTVNARVQNLFNARSLWDRTVYSGPRNTAPVAFHEDRDRLIGPIFRLTVKGNF